MSHWVPTLFQPLNRVLRGWPSTRSTSRVSSVVLLAMLDQRFSFDIHTDDYYIPVFKSHTNTLLLPTRVSQKRWFGFSPSKDLIWLNVTHKQVIQSSGLGGTRSPPGQQATTSVSASNLPCLSLRMESATLCPCQKNKHWPHLEHIAPKHFAFINTIRLYPGLVYMSEDRS